MRVFEEVRRIMDRAVSLKEREEEIPMWPTGSGCPRTAWRCCCAAARRAGAARSGAGRERGGRPGIAMAERLLGSEAVIEREFLVAAACNPAGRRHA